MNIETGKCPCKTEPSYGLKQEIASVNGATVLTAEVKSLLGELNIDTVKYPWLRFSSLSKLRRLTEKMALKPRIDWFKCLEIDFDCDSPVQVSPED